MRHSESPSVGDEPASASSVPIATSYLGRFPCRTALAAFLTLAILPAAQGDDPRAARDSAPRSRSFTFTYGGAVTAQKPGATVRVWLPVPSSSEDQVVRLSRIELPAAGSFDREPKYGNELLSFSAPADERGRVAFEVAYRDENDGWWLGLNGRAAGWLGLSAETNSPGKNRFPPHAAPVHCIPIA